jgi:hypothetical protein
MKMRLNKVALISIALAMLTLSVPLAFAPTPPCCPPGKVTGGGWFICACYGVRTNFGFNAVRYPGENVVKGELEYQDHTLGLNVHAHDIDTLCVSADKKRAEFTGPCTINHVGGFRFKVYVEDNGEPGKADVFELWLYGLTEYPTYHAVGHPISGGNIQIHKKP